MRVLKYAIVLGFSAVIPVSAAETVETARPVPLTRPQMKQLLEDMKHRPLRIPLPELTEADKAALGERADSYESRLRYHYMPEGTESVFGGGIRRDRNATGANANNRPRDFTRNADANMTLSYPFKTRLFWIVSRTNNCQYCLGHQEQKLSAAGMTEAEIAALDMDWSRFPAAEQAAFAYARKLTYEPFALGDADIATLREHYTDLQILEMTMSVAGNNAINRWKEGSGTPQSHSGTNFFNRPGLTPAAGPLPIESFLTPTAPEFEQSLSKVVTVAKDPQSGQPTATAITTRGKLEPRPEVEAALEAARTRMSRLPLLDEATARTALGDSAVAGKLPNWQRLMANFPSEAGGRIRSLNALTEERGDLSLLLKAQVSWIIARHDRAWYAAAVAQQQLRKLGQTDDQIYALDGDWNSFSSADRALFQFAVNLASTPIALTDADVAEALAQAGPRKVVQLINFVTSRAYFDRVTEAAGLPLD